MSLPPVLKTRIVQVQASIPPGTEIYLVGGAIRDLLLGRPTHDLDFVLPRDAIRVARQVANALQAAFYILDEERETGRVILTEPDGSRQFLDFATLRGPDLESDLRARDFTINAIALDVQSPQSFVDPLHGAMDLQKKQLRACSPTSFIDDPLRIIRGVRLAADFSFRILSETSQLMREAVPGLNRISPERLRDEVFRVLGAPQPEASVRALDRLGVLSRIMPELVAMKGVVQSPPHIADVWTHSLGVLQKLDVLFQVLKLTPEPDGSANLFLGLISVRLGRYREQLHAHLSNSLNPDRSLRQLLLFTALYHDVGKPKTRRVDEAGRIRFFEHELVGADIAAERARALRLSTPEIDRLRTIIRNHLRPILLASSGHQPSRRAIYRFFRDTGPAGVDVCLLSMADVLATYGPTLPQEVWAHHLDVVRALLEAWWERPEESVSPPILVTGHDLMKKFDLKPGPEIGKLLNAIREAQATGKIETLEDAMALAASIQAGSEPDTED